MAKVRKKKFTNLSSYSTVDILLAVFGFVFVALTIFTISSSNRKPQKITTQAQEQQEIIRIQAELKDKPLSTVCSQHQAQVISPFSNCPQGQARLSDNQENPLFYCCR